MLIFLNYKSLTYLRSKKEKMKSTETHLMKNLIKHSPLAVCIIDAQSGLIEIYNDKFLELHIKNSVSHSEKHLLDFLNNEFNADHQLISKVVE